MNTHSWTMASLLRRLAALSALALATVTSANATVIRFDFTGTVTASEIGDPVGNSIAGWLQYDTAISSTFANSTTGRLTYFATGPRPLVIAGQWAVAGGSSASVGDGEYFSQRIEIWQRPGFDQYILNASDQTSESDQSNLQRIGLNILQFASPSGIFDPPGNFAFDQHVNWFNPGAAYDTYIRTADGGTSFALLTMTISVEGEAQACQEARAGLCDALAAHIPEPGTLALLGVGLGGLAVASRRKF